MSLKEDCPSSPRKPENPTGGGFLGETSALSLNPLERPLDRIYGPTEDSDWQEAFWASLRPPAQAPSSTPGRGEDTSDTMDQELPDANTSDNQPIELNENAQVIELDVPVVTISTEVLGPLWSQQFISCSSPPQYTSIPLYRAEGREDPDPDEGIDEPSSPLTSITSPNPFISGLASPSAPTTITIDHHSHNHQVLPQPPEEFFDMCNILHGVIDDSITPNSFAPDILASATVTSGELHQQTRVTTETFITPIKTEESDPTPTIATSSSFTIPPSPSVKSELDDSDWEPESFQANRSVRKRGRPSKPPGCRTITPLPTTTQHPDSNLGDSMMMTDDEVSAQKYRRMRDLNNEASRRCRETRKEKAEAREIEAQYLEQKNLRLKRKVAEMEAEIKRMKKMVFDDIRNSKRILEIGQEIQTSQQQLTDDEFLKILDYPDKTTWP